MSTPEAERRVSQLRHDVDDVYEIVSSHSSELREIRSTLAEHGAKLDEQGVMLAEVLTLLRGGPAGSGPAE